MLGGFTLYRIEKKVTNKLILLPSDLLFLIFDSINFNSFHKKKKNRDSVKMWLTAKQSI